VKKRTAVLLVALLVFSNILTYRVTRGLYRWRAYTPPSSSYSDDNAYRREHREELAPFFEVLDILTERYIDEVSIEELVEAAIKGMVGILDSQSGYLDSRHWQMMMDQTKGSFSGIGIEISAIDGYITVIAPIRGTPGEQAGLLPEDRIVEVDSKDIRGISTVEAVMLIRGPEGSKVTLKVLRGEDNSEHVFTITRGNITMSSVFHSMVEDRVGYIEITNFDDHTGEDFSIALMELENDGMAGLILDLRGNTGGLLSEAVKVGQALLPPGPITFMVDRNGKKLDTYVSYGPAKPYPIVVLVNSVSASASEIIAGALQDTGAGILVGTRTYGKATVQNLEKLTGNTGLRYTMAKYQTPGGRDIDGVGLEPDVAVELSDRYVYLHPLTTDLKIGDESGSVTFLQRALNTAGYRVAESGVFDKETESAVRAFQSAYGLAQSGMVRYETRKKLQEVAEAELEKLDNQKLTAIEILLEKIS
jgi:carboxyl-terminal processing protease